MKKKFLINIVLVIAVNLAIKPIWIFGIDRNVQLNLGDEAYGMYAALVNLSIVFNILLDMGLTNLNNKLVSENNNLLQENLLNIAVVKLFLFIIYLLALGICALIFDYNYVSLQILVGVAIIQFLNSFLTFLRSNISANQLFKSDSIISVADKLLMIVMIGYIFYSPNILAEFTIYTYISCQIYAYLIIIMIALVFTKKIVSESLHFSWQKFMPIIKQSIPYAILILLMGIYMRSDLFLLERWLPDGASQSGMYIKSFRLLDACNMIGFLFAGILLPMFAKQISEKISILPLLQISAKLLLPGGIAVAIFCIFQASTISQIMYHKQDAQLVLSFQLIMIVLPAMCIMNIYSTLLTSAGKINKLILITGIGALASIVLNYFSIAYFKNYIGVCIVAIIVQYSINIGYIIGCVQEFGFSVFNTLIKYIIVTTILYIAINFILSYLSIPFSWAIIANIITFIPLFYWLGFFKISTLKQFFIAK